jgi:hypothetical protein
LARQEALLRNDAARQQELAGVAAALEAFRARVQRGLAKADFERRRQRVMLLSDRVVVTNADVEIRYVLPITPESEHVRFCQLRKDYFDDPAQLGPGDDLPSRVCARDIVGVSSRQCSGSTPAGGSCSATSTRVRRTLGGRSRALPRGRLRTTVPKRNVRRTVRPGSCGPRQGSTIVRVSASGKLAPVAYSPAPVARRRSCMTRVRR